MKARIAIAALAVLGAVACGGPTTGGSGEDECAEGAVCAPENPEPVPDVVGMRLGSACLVMTEADYHGGVRKIINNSDAPSGTILRLETAAGTRASQAESS